MPQTLFKFFLTVTAFLAAALTVDAALWSQEWPDYVDPSADGSSDFRRGPGFYLAWWKILLCIPVFLFWVKAADWVNVDLHRTREQTKLEFDTWNPALSFSFLGGFVILLCVPLFWIGYPLYLVGGLLPFFLYVGQRNKKVPKGERTLFPVHRKKMVDTAPIVLKQDEGIKIEFTAGGNDPQRSQSNLIAARQNPFFLQLKEFIHDVMFKRADRVQLEFTQQAVAMRYEIDGMWLNMPPRDRQSGDAILYAIKQLANMNPMDRQSRQVGSFKAANETGKKVAVEVTSAGIPTGERVVFKVIEQKKKQVMNILQLGMMPEMLERLRPIINQPGYVVVTAMPGDGLSSSWLGVLDAADRVTRDFVGVCDKTFQDKVIENVEYREYDKAAGETPRAELVNLALKLPQAFVVPDANDGETINYLCDQIEAEEMFCISQIHAKSAIEAVIRMLMLKPDRSKFAKYLTGVVSHRLFRRLCDKCKQPYQPPPQLLKQLGIAMDPNLRFFQEYQPPPPEQLIDDKGRPIEPPPPCAVCGGVGYFGRIGVFELLEITDPIRQAMVNNPSLNGIGEAAKASGHRVLQTEAIQLLTNGITSVQEIQRVLKK